MGRKVPNMDTMLMKHPLPLAEETITLQNGAGRISHVSNGFALSSLRIDGKPFVCSGHDGGGSVGQELLYQVGAEAEEITRSFRRLVEGELDTSKPLAPQLQPFLALFAPGEYRLQAWELPRGMCGGIDWELTDSWYSGFYSYYPDYFDLVRTCPLEFFDFATGERWKERIQAGERPWVVSTSLKGSYKQRYILDGHHKTYGYGWSQLPLRLLDIVCLTPQIDTSLTLIKPPGAFQK